MVNWIARDLQHDPSSELENVDVEIQVLGLKRPVMPFLAQSALVCFMFLSPLLFWVGPLLLWYASWRFWQAEQGGRPIEYEPWFKARFGCQPVYELFKVVPHLKHGDGVYR